MFFLIFNIVTPHCVAILHTSHCIFISIQDSPLIPLAPPHSHLAHTPPHSLFLEPATALTEFSFPFFYTSFPILYSLYIMPGRYNVPSPVSITSPPPTLPPLSSQSDLRISHCTDQMPSAVFLLVTHGLCPSCYTFHPPYIIHHLPSISHSPTPSFTCCTL